MAGRCTALARLRRRRWAAEQRRPPVPAWGAQGSQCVPSHALSAAHPPGDRRNLQRTEWRMRTSCSGGGGRRFCCRVGRLSRGVSSRDGEAHREARTEERWGPASLHHPPPTGKAPRRGRAGMGAPPRLGQALPSSNCTLITAVKSYISPLSAVMAQGAQVQCSSHSGGLEA